MVDLDLTYWLLFKTSGRPFFKLLQLCKRHSCARMFQIVDINYLNCCVLEKVLCSRSLLLFWRISWLWLSVLMVLGRSREFLWIRSYTDKLVLTRLFSTLHICHWFIVTCKIKRRTRGYSGGFLNVQFTAGKLKILVKILLNNCSCLL